MQKLQYFFLLGAVLLLWRCDDGIEIRDPGEPPVADFIFQIDINNPRRINFASTSQNATVISWDFGDDIGRSSQQSTSYVYPKNGTYEVALTASNLAGIHTKRATITVEGPVAPTADFALSFENIQNNLQVRIVNRSENVRTYNWQFGDGNTSTAAEPGLYTYTQPGTYTIQLDVVGERENLTARRRITLLVLDNRQLSGATSKTWQFFTGERNGLPGYYVTRNGLFAYATQFKDCELDDEYTFAANGNYDNDNKGTARLFSQGGECRTFNNPAPTRFSLRRNSLTNFQLEVGNSYLGDAETNNLYRVVELSEQFLVVQYEKNNPLNPAQRDVAIMTFQPK